MTRTDITLARAAKRGLRPVGRRSLVHDHTIVTTILTSIEEGFTLSSACALAGVHESTAHDWNGRGWAERARREEAWPDPCTDCGATNWTPAHRGHLRVPQAREEEPYVEFAEALARARATIEGTCLTSIRSSIEGGFVKKDITRIERGGDEVHEVEYAQPDGKLALEFLARTRPRDYGKINSPLQVTAELSGPGGGPIPIEDSALAPLAQRIMQALEQQEADRLSAPALTQQMLDKQAAERRDPRIIEAREDD